MLAIFLKAAVFGVAGAALGIIAMAVVNVAMQTERRHPAQPPSSRPPGNNTGNGPRKRRRSRDRGANIQKETMIDELRSNTVDCIICLGKIEPEQPIFVCRHNCHKFFHLSCTEKWAQIKRSGNLNGLWTCPHCFHEYSDLVSNLRSLCFCGQTENPKLVLHHIAAIRGVDALTDVIPALARTYNGNYTRSDIANCDPDPQMVPAPTQELLIILGTLVNKNS